MEECMSRNRILYFSKFVWVTDGYLFDLEIELVHETETIP